MQRLAEEKVIKANIITVNSPLAEVLTPKAQHRRNDTSWSYDALSRPFTSVPGNCSLPYLGWGGGKSTGESPHEIPNKLIS